MADIGMSVSLGTVDGMQSVVGSVINDLGVAAPIVIVGGAALGLYRAATSVYNRTLGSRRNLVRRLNQLATGVTVRYIEERFGTPAFARTITRPHHSPDEEPARPHRQPLINLARIFPDASPSAGRPQVTADAAVSGAGTPRAGQQFRELVYREKHAWIQVLADENDAVARFSITVTDPKFKFPGRELTWGHLAVRLGHSRFSDVRADLATDGRSLRIGAHNHEYAESYWFGNPGNYQRYVLSNNEIGTGEFGYSILREGPPWHRSGTLALDYPLPADQPQFDPDAAYASQFRSQTTINTLTVLGPHRPPADLAEPRGPDSNHVRVLVPGRRERRQARRRLRQIEQKSLRDHQQSSPLQLPTDSIESNVS